MLGGMPVLDSKASENLFSTALGGLYQIYSFTPYKQQIDDTYPDHKQDLHTIVHHAQYDNVVIMVIMNRIPGKTRVLIVT